MSHFSDTKAAIAGGLCSIFGNYFIGFIGDVLSAFILGGVGALGGWLVNKLLNRKK